MSPKKPKPRIAQGRPGFFRAWILALVRPATLYARPIGERSQWSPVLQALMLTVFVAFLEAGWDMVGAGLHGLRLGRFIIRGGLLLIAGPLLFQVAMLLAAILAHLLLWFLRGRHKSFSETLQVFSFAQAPVVFFVLPVVGPVLALVWLLVLLMRGLAIVQRARWWRPPVAVLVLLAGTLFGLLRLSGAEMESSSMYPGILAGDRLWVERDSLWLSVPERGEVVAFYRLNEDEEESIWVKRLVAIAGDTVEVRGGKLLLNGQQVPDQTSDNDCFYQKVVSADGGEPIDCAIWIEQLGSHRYPVAVAVDTGRDKAPPDFPPTKLPEGTVFVLGDNRDNSQDSRQFGPIQSNRLVGRVRGILWSQGPQGARWERLLSKVR